MRVIAIAAALLAATPAAAQGTDQRYLSGLAGKAEFFWAKGAQYSGDVEPVMAPVTSIQWSNDCEMVVYFGKGSNGFAPYQSPVFIKWGSIQTVDIAGTFFIFRHRLTEFMPGYRWGLWVPDNEKARMTQVMQNMINNCDG